MLEWLKKKFDKEDQSSSKKEPVEDKSELKNDEEEITEADELVEEQVSDETEISNSDLDEDNTKESIEEKDESSELVHPIEDELESKEEKPEEIEIQEQTSDSKETSIFQKLKDGLTKTRDDIGYKVNDILGNYVTIDEDMMEELEYLLISADVGMETTMELIDRLKNRIREDQVKDPKKVLPLLAEEIEKMMEQSVTQAGLEFTEDPMVILVIGVNGVGKTTTIGKLAYQLKKEGKSVLIAAGDTFRAAAIEQLETWGDRVDVPVIKHTEGADPAAVIYDGIQAAKARNTDVLICDTAGRLHNKGNLMKELEKIHRVIERDFSEAKKEVLLVLDATTGQNAVSQAKTFNEVTDITGIVLTKLDGTAKGGVVIQLQTQFDIPIKFVGVGEGMEDLQPFVASDFTKALLDIEVEK